MKKVLLKNNWILPECNRFKSIFSKNQSQIFDYNFLKIHSFNQVYIFYIKLILIIYFTGKLI
jgi:hypothetical protein